MKWALVLLLFLPSLGMAAELPQIALKIDPQCADSSAEGLLVRELRTRLPENTLTFGEPLERDWRVVWSEEFECRILVNREEQESIIKVNSSEVREIEYAASQVAWIVTMTRDAEAAKPVVPAKPEVVEEPDEPEVPVEPVEPAEPEEPTEPEVPAEPAVAQESLPEGTDGILMAATLIPTPESASIVPNLAINLIGGYRGLDGLELGFGNMEDEFMHGAQFAVIFNRVAGTSRGLQAAFAYNHTAVYHSGLQLAFGVNHAGDVNGAQVGAVNLADRVSGAQVGFVNVADTADLSLGLVSIMRDEPIYGVAWISSSGFLLGGIQHGSKHFRTMLFLGGAATGLEEGQVGAAGLGLSVHLPLTDWFYLDIDYLATQVAVADYRKQSHLSMFRLLTGFKPGEHFAIYLGPAVAGLFSGREDGLAIPPDYAVRNGDAVNGYTWFWPEFHLGVRF